MTILMMMMIVHLSYECDYDNTDEKDEDDDEVRIIGGSYHLELVFRWNGSDKSLLAFHLSVDGVDQM